MNLCCAEFWFEQLQLWFWRGANFWNTFINLNSEKNSSSTWPHQNVDKDSCDNNYDLIPQSFNVSKTIKSHFIKLICFIWCWCRCLGEVDIEGSIKINKRKTYCIQPLLLILGIFGTKKVLNRQLIEKHKSKGYVRLFGLTKPPLFTVFINISLIRLWILFLNWTVKLFFLFALLKSEYSFSLYTEPQPKKYLVECVFLSIS